MEGVSTHFWRVVVRKLVLAALAAWVISLPSVVHAQWRGEHGRGRGRDVRARKSSNRAPDISAAAAISSACCATSPARGSIVRMRTSAPTGRRAATGQEGGADKPPRRGVGVASAEPRGTSQRSLPEVYCRAVGPRAGMTQHILYAFAASPTMGILLLAISGMPRAGCRRWRTAPTAAPESGHRRQRRHPSPSV